MIQKWLFICCLIFLAVGAHAEEYCFSTQKEYEAVKAFLPNQLQNLYKTPLYFYYDGTIVKAAGRLNFADGQARFFLNANVLSNPINDPVKLCVENSVIKMVFPNGKSESIALVGDSKVKTQGKEASIVSEKVFRDVARALISNMDATSTNSTSGSQNGGAKQ